MAERGLRSVILIGGGEPTLHPGFESFVRFAKGLSLQIAVVSNGSRGDRLLEIADALGPGDWLRLSLDAGSDELFRAMHRPVSRSLTLDEICAWVPRIKARNPGLRIGYSYIIVWRGASRDGVALHENIDEIVLGDGAGAPLRLRLHRAQARARAGAGRRRGDGSGRRPGGALARGGADPRRGREGPRAGLATASAST